MKKLLAVLLIALGTGAQAQPLTILTEDYPPYNFQEGETVRGAATDQVRLILEETKIEYSLELLPWARAYALAESQPATCLYTTGHSAERHDKFKWIEPLLVDRMAMVRKSGAAIAPASVEDAKRFTIGTQLGDFSEEFLKRQGFPSIDLAPDVQLTLKKLLGNRIDLMMTSEKTFETMKASGAAVEAVLLLDGRNYGLACHPSVADDVIHRLQAALDGLIKDGTQDRIFIEYGLTPNRR